MGIVRKMWAGQENATGTVYWGIPFQFLWFFFKIPTRQVGRNIQTVHIKENHIPLPCHSGLSRIDSGVALLPRMTTGFRSKSGITRKSYNINV